MNDVVVSIKLSPKQAGELYMRHERLKTENARLRKQIDDARACLVCAAIADPMEVCENTLAILTETETPG